MAKLIHCDGRTLEVRDIGPVLFRLRARDVPIKRNGYEILEDDEARRVLRDLLDGGLYEGGAVR